MKFEKILETANRESVITTGLLLAGDVESAVPQAQPLPPVAEGRIFDLGEALQIERSGLIGEAAIPTRASGSTVHYRASLCSSTTGAGCPGGF